MASPLEVESLFSLKITLRCLDGKGESGLLLDAEEEEDVQLGGEYSSRVAHDDFEVQQHSQPNGDCEDAAEWRVDRIWRSAGGISTPNCHFLEQFLGRCRPFFTQQPPPRTDDCYPLQWSSTTSAKKWSSLAAAR